MMKIDEILDVIKGLAKSQGFYGRLYQGWMEVRDNDEDEWNQLVEELESEEFEKPLDVILFLEEGKSKFKRVLEIKKDGKVIQRAEDDDDIKDTILELMESKFYAIKESYKTLINKIEPHNLIEVLKELGCETEVIKMKAEEDA